MKTDFAKAFRVIRAAYGLQQAELANRIDISASQLSLIEKGKRQPSWNVVRRLSAALGIPTSLITLLASGPDEIVNDDVSELSRALLRLLVNASPEDQTTLPLGPP